MGPQAVSEFSICGIKEILTDVTQEVKVTNEIRHSGEHLFNRFAYSVSHIMHRGYRCSVGLFDVFQKGDNMIGVLAWNFDIGKHDFAETVKTCHQSGGIARVRCIQMENIATGKCHGLANPRYRVLVSTGQVQNELTPQIIDLRGAQRHIAGSQFGACLFRGFMPLIKCPSNKNHHIVCDV